MLTDAYKTIETAANAELIIERSRFLSFAFPVGSPAEADINLAALRKEHPFATHICYGYSADGLGTIKKSSDDGEPKGTAGVPILDCIVKSGLTCVLVAVVRYFGGVKLGAGGLVRAYSNAASLALAAANTVTMRRMQVFSLTLDFSDAAKIKNLLNSAELARTYDSSVIIKLAACNLSVAQSELDSVLCRSAELKLLGIKWMKLV